MSDSEFRVSCGNLKHCGIPQILGLNNKLEGLFSLCFNDSLASEGMIFGTNNGNVTAVEDHVLKTALLSRVEIEGNGVFGSVELKTDDVLDKVYNAFFYTLLYYNLFLDGSGGGSVALSTGSSMASNSLRSLESLRSLGCKSRPCKIHVRKVFRVLKVLKVFRDFRPKF